MSAFPPPYTLVLEEVCEPVDLWARFTRIERDRAPILLDSGGSVEEARYSILVHSPSRVHAVTGRDLAPLDRAQRLERLFAPLQDVPRCEATREGRAGGLPFLGGWVGAIDYEAAAFIAAHPIAPRDSSLDRELLWMGFYSRGWICDRLRERIWRFSLDPDLVTAPSLVMPGAQGAPVREPLPDRAAFEELVRRALVHIRAGDIYQVNLSQPILDAEVEDELELYGILREVSPAPYGACLRLPGRSLLSNSPELFFRLEGDTVETLPIKGTRRRFPGDPERDRAALNELELSAKDRAELLMIVDLYRNDLGRLAQPGTVLVPGGLRSRSFANVHHLLALVRAERAPGTGISQLLAALYPAGSITGAPKLRAQEIIRALEPGPRGIYTGAIGFIDVFGRSCFNVAIRTGEVCGGRLVLRMGAGIVADSDPAEEYEEIVAKGSAWLEAVRRARSRCEVRR